MTMAFFEKPNDKSYPPWKPYNDCSSMTEVHAEHNFSLRVQALAQSFLLASITCNSRTCITLFTYFLYILYYYYLMIVILHNNL